MQDISTASEAIGLRRSATYLPEIESLRGIAMTLVYLFHLHAHFGGVPKNAEDRVVSPLFALIASGQTGVSLFFLLSGFLLSLPFLAEATGGRRVNRWHYFQRRALRILPLYYTAVLIGTVLCAHKAADLLNGVPYLFFLNSVAGWSVKLWPYSNTWWSLATEAQYYVLLPLLPFCFTSRTGRRAGIAVFSVYAALFAAFIAGKFGMSTLPGNLVLKLSLFGRAPFFLYGITVAWVYQHYGDHLRKRLARVGWLRWGGADLILFGVVMALGFELRWRYQILYDNPPDFAWHLVEGFLWATILTLVLLAPLRLKSLIANPVLGHLGILSYSMYLWHEPITYWVPRFLVLWGVRWAPGWNAFTGLMAVGVTIVCLGVAQLTYSYIERPFLTRKARIE